MLSWHLHWYLMMKCLTVFLCVLFVRRKSICSAKSNKVVCSRQRYICLGKHVIRIWPAVSWIGSSNKNWSIWTKFPFCNYIFMRYLFILTMFSVFLFVISIALAHRFIMTPVATRLIGKYYLIRCIILKTNTIINQVHFLWCFVGV